MDEFRWERFGALGGVAFVVLDGVVAVLGGEPPGSGASASEVAVYYADHNSALVTGQWLFGFACMALAWWFGSLWRQMVRDEGGTPRLAIVSLIGLALAGRSL